MVGVVGVVNAPLPPLILEGELVTPAAPREEGEFVTPATPRDEGEFVTPAAPRDEGELVTPAAPRDEGEFVTSDALRDEGEFVSSTTLSIFSDSIININANNSAKSKRSHLKQGQSAI